MLMNCSRLCLKLFGRVKGNVLDFLCSVPTCFLSIWVYITWTSTFPPFSPLTFDTCVCKTWANFSAQNWRQMSVWIHRIGCGTVAVPISSDLYFCILCSVWMRQKQVSHGFWFLISWRLPASTRGQCHSQSKSRLTELYSPLQLHAFTMRPTCIYSWLNRLKKL